MKIAHKSRTYLNNLLEDNFIPTSRLKNSNINHPIYKSKFHTWTMESVFFIDTWSSFMQFSIMNVKFHLHFSSIDN